MRLKCIVAYLWADMRLMFVLGLLKTFQGVNSLMWLIVFIHTLNNKNDAGLPLLCIFALLGFDHHLKL